MIIAYAQMLFEDIPDGELKEFAEAILNSGKKANGIIEALLLLARVHSTATVEMKPLDMAEIIKARLLMLLDKGKFTSPPMFLLLAITWIDRMAHAPVISR